MSKYNAIALGESEHKVPNFGTMFIGGTKKDESGKFVADCNGKAVGEFKRKKDAEVAVIEFWQQNYSGSALSKRYKSNTKGGFPIEFNHEVSGKIVARVRDSGRWFVTTWNLDGTIDLSDENDRYDLVPR